MFEFIRNIKFKKMIKKKDDRDDNRKDKEGILSRKIDELNHTLLKSNILEITTLIGNKKEIFLRNFMAGISRGIGIGIGVTLITAILVYILQKIITLNIPVIGEYARDIFEIVNNSKY